MSQQSLTRVFYRKGVPLWRDVVVLQWVAQILSAILVLGFMWFFVSNVLRGAEARGLSWSYSFLKEAAGFPISESLIPYDASYSFARAFIVGLLNTLKVALVGVVLATLLGIIAAIARLSTNWLVSQIASVYIEIIRNVPLLVQLFFWYFGFFQRLPAVSGCPHPAWPYLSQPAGPVHGLGQTNPDVLDLDDLCGCGTGARLGRVPGPERYQIQTGRTTYPVASAFAVLVGLPLVGWFLVGDTLWSPMSRCWASSILMED